MCTSTPFAPSASGRTAAPYVTFEPGARFNRHSRRLGQEDKVLEWMEKVGNEQYGK
jgi:hypothetical protein